MPPEIVELFKDWPAGLLLVFLAAPFFVLAGVVITGIIQRFRDRDAHKVAKAGVAISETEAETHQFQAIIDGFTKSLAAVSKRAEDAETKATAADIKANAAQEKAEAAETKANRLSRRVRRLENERHDAIDHVLLLEKLIPYPPGPPTRPIWMQQHLVTEEDPDDWDTEETGK